MADVSVINLGAHEHALREYGEGLQRGVLAARCARAVVDGGGRANQTVLVRNTPIGHPNCTARSAPLAPEQATRAALLGHLPADSPVLRKFTWQLFEQFNAIAARAVRACAACGCFGAGRGALLDVAAMSDARPDLHEFARLRGDADQGDCLHWHETPEGASLNDWWVALLYNTLDALFPDA